ncbi:RNA polymerase sigma-70 factor, sigma-E family [Actinopolyspora lacussalsi subsp. righensis]|uniref:RNA polymerase sigma-70 factor, sigma-E family n=1 Tax=Actinopolyspora righensis TaxID=995060 RepID=A0A1I7BX09_9ACTN|nr:SigE family RNA polymerase sigma factor [Actinopolyspora righensis]SFT91661.1 RNA polymerase sigma-70 factor, sigma-E family [Actinopolyspora righensis]
MRQSEESFRAFARTHATQLRRSAYLLCGDWHLAEDLVQNTFIKLYRRWRRVGSDTAVRYARKTLLRVWLDERRRPWRRAEHRFGAVPERAHSESDPALLGQRGFTRNMLLDALSDLPPRQRAVLVLRYWEDLPIAEVATVMRCSEGTVKSQAARGLRSLRTEIVDRDPERFGIAVEGTV